MSDYGSVEDIKRKIREGIYNTFVKDSEKKWTAEILLAEQFSVIIEVAHNRKVRWICL